MKVFAAVCLTLALLGAVMTCQNPSKNYARAPIDVLALGRQRADFGSPTLETESFRNIPRTVVNSTYLSLFPVGRAELRYDVDSFPEPTERMPRARYFLTRYSKAKGVVKVDWVVELAYNEGLELNDDYKGSSSLGSLESFLLALGLRPQDHLSDAVKGSLESRNGFAAYRFHFITGLDSFFVAENGTIVRDKQRSTEVDFSDEKQWPKTRKPYPVTLTERAMLKR